MSFLSRFEIGAQRPLMVRRERVANVGVGKRLLFASDLHLKRNGPGHILAGLIQIAAREAPDVIVFGGDLVDRESGLNALQLLISRLSEYAPVCAVAGNHDEWLGLRKVRAAVIGGGGHWLHDAPFHICGDSAIYGSRDQPLLAAKRHVLCAHHPSAPARPFDLTLSGHLHGGQFVFYERGGRFYPGAFLYRWNGLRFEDDDGRTLLISRGVQDTLPLRWNCPREALIVEL